MTYRTPEEAGQMSCPIARTRPDLDADGKIKSKCSGPDCILWRWKPRLATDPEFKSAIQREMAVLAQEAKSDNSMKFHKEAVANVMSDPEGFGIASERGYCGLAPVPT